jgi:hypothetical protein
LVLPAADGGGGGGGGSVADAVGQGVVTGCKAVVVKQPQQQRMGRSYDGCLHPAKEEAAHSKESITMVDCIVQWEMIVGIGQYTSCSQ